MTRLVVVAVLLVGLAVATTAYRRHRRRITDRTGVDHPPLPADLVGTGRTWIVFATRYCATCGPVVDRLRAMHPDETVHKVLVEERPDLAGAHRVRTAPTVLEVDASGRVVHWVAGAEPVLGYVSALASV